MVDGVEKWGMGNPRDFNYRNHIYFIFKRNDTLVIVKSIWINNWVILQNNEANKYESFGYHVKHIKNADSCYDILQNQNYLWSMIQPFLSVCKNNETEYDNMLCRKENIMYYDRIIIRMTIINQSVIRKNISGDFCFTVCFFPPSS